MLIWGAVLAIHILGVVAWVGGMAYALLVLRPSLAVLALPDRLSMHMQTLRRFLLIVWHAMPLVILSGYVMLFGFYGGFGEVNWTVHTMHLLGLLMAAVFLMIFFGPWKALRRAPDPDLVVSIRHLITVNLVLGVVTIVIASLGHFG